MFGWSDTIAPGGATHTTEAGTDPVIVTRGLLAGTRVASNLGWRPVEALAAGDKVLTFDHGMQPVAEVRREQLWIDATRVPLDHWPIRVPAGVLANRVALDLLPDQGVLIESDCARDAYGDPFAVVPARALESVRGIARVPPRAQVEVVTLVFDSDQIVYAEGGALAHCAQAETKLAEMVRGDAPCYEMLPLRAATRAVAGMVMEDRAIGAGGYATARKAMAC